jgi:hypothetical protein
VLEASFLEAGLLELGPCALIVAVALPATLWRFRVRTTG